MKKLIAVIGARPQFIKHFPFEVQAKKEFELLTIHTGQHYDNNMSQVFFDQLGMSKPSYMLDLGGGSHGSQTGQMLEAIEGIFIKEKPDGIVVYGDTNSTLAGALAGAKLHIPIIHIEAGLRSFNKKMPEEINRILTDHVSSLLLVPSENAKQHLKKEGIEDGVYVVGDIMKDLVLNSLEQGLLKPQTDILNYFYVTLHRPYNVDQKERLSEVLEAIAKLDENVFFSVHPRTRNRIKEFGLMELIEDSKVRLIDPQPYFENLSYLYFSNGLITDSGGMQKEAYWLKKQCITVRTETEWIETIEKGNNKLVFENLGDIKFGNIVEGFDESLYGLGSTSTVIVQNIMALFSNSNIVK